MSTVYLTTKEAAEKLGLSEETVRQWAKIGKIPAEKIGTGTKREHYRVHCSAINLPASQK